MPLSAECHTQEFAGELLQRTARARHDLFLLGPNLFDRAFAERQFLGHEPARRHRRVWISAVLRGGVFGKAVFLVYDLHAHRDGPIPYNGVLRARSAFRLRRPVDKPLPDELMKVSRNLHAEATSPAGVLP